MSRRSTWRGYIKFTQRFINRTAEEEKAATIQNAFYTLQLDYSRYENNVEDFVHADRFFDYGYVGKFVTLNAPTVRTPRCRANGCRPVSRIRLWPLHPRIRRTRIWQR